MNQERWHKITGIFEAALFRNDVYLCGFAAAHGGKPPAYR